MTDVSPALVSSLAAVLFTGIVVCLGIAQISATLSAMGMAREKGHGFFSILLCLIPLVGVCSIYVGIDHIVSFGLDSTAQALLILGPLALFIVPLMLSLGYLMWHRSSIRWVVKYLVAGLLMLLALTALWYYLFSSGLVKMNPARRTASQTIEMQAQQREASPAFDNADLR